MKVRLEILVSANAKKSQIVGMHGDRLKVKIKAPPVDGKANDEIIRFFSDVLGVAKSKVKIVSGETSKMKTLEIIGIDQSTVSKRVSS